MALTPTKTWEYIVNETRSGGTLTTRNAGLWLALKQCLTNTGSLQAVDAAGANTSLSSPWVVVTSSNTVVANNSDNWNTTADIVGGGVGSWIHLRQVDYFGSGDHLNLLLAVQNDSDGSLGYMGWVRGAIGYASSGTTGVLPAVEPGATEIQTLNGTSPGGNPGVSDVMWGSDGVNANATLHFRMSDDGQAGTWWICAGGNCIATHGWQADEEGVPGRVNPFFVWSVSQDITTEINRWTSNSTWNTYALIRTLDDFDSEISLNVTMPVSGTIETPAIENNNDNRFLMPIFLVDQTNGIIHGVFTDQWWSSDAETTGDQSPSTPPVVRTQIGQMVIPWPSGVSAVVA